MPRGRPRGSKNRPKPSINRLVLKMRRGTPYPPARSRYNKSFLPLWKRQRSLNYRGSVFWKEKVTTVMIMNPTSDPTNPDLTDNTWMNPNDRTGYSYHTYSFDRLGNADALRGMFKKFRMVGVKSTFYKVQNNGNSSQILHRIQGTSTPIPGGGSVTQDLDRITYKPDMYNKSSQMYYKFTDQTATGVNQTVMTTWRTIDQASEADAKVRPWKGNGFVSVYIKPNPVVKLDLAGSADTDFVLTKAPKGSWHPTNKYDVVGADTIANDTQFRGLRCAWSQLAPTNWDENRDAPPTIKRVDTYYFQFKSQY